MPPGCILIRAIPNPTDRMDQPADPLASLPVAVRPTVARRFLLVVLAAVLLGAGFVGILSLVQSRKKSPTAALVSPVPSASPSQSAAEQEGKALGAACQGTGSRQLGALPLRFQDIGFVLPSGRMSGTQVIPGDSQQYVGADASAKSDTYPVFAPADGILVGVQSSLSPGSDGFRVLIAYSCTFFSYVDQLTSLDGTVTSQLPPAWDAMAPLQTAIPIRQGQRIGGSSGSGVAFGLWDLNKRDMGYAVPLAYSSQPGKIHSVPPGDYFQSDLAYQVSAKYARTVRPLDGKSDYDQDGRLVGSWFVAGSDGIMGANPAKRYAGQISFAYDALDPVVPEISLGDFSGNPGQFLVSGNGPVPAGITAQSGLIKYELLPVTGYARADGSRWNGTGLAQNLAPTAQATSLGTLLVQLLGPDNLRVEVVPGKTPAHVSAFSSAFQTYDRGNAATDQSGGK